MPETRKDKNQKMRGKSAMLMASRLLWDGIMSKPIHTCGCGERPPALPKRREGRRQGGQQPGARDRTTGFRRKPLSWVIRWSANP